MGPCRFLFVDNHDPAALFEFALDGDLGIDWMRRRPLRGLADTALSDPEGLARIDRDGVKFLVAVSSLSVPGDGRRAHDGLIRIRYSPEGDLIAEAMPGFRAWLLAHVSALAEFADLTPDEGGLNVEGVAWQPRSSSLILGLRGPVQSGRVGVIRIPVDPGRAWDIAALGNPTLAWVRIPNSAGAEGIRDVCFDEQADEFMIVLGRSISGGQEPFRLCAWDGISREVELRDVRFHRSAKPEGITTFTVGGVRKILAVDDGGGYAIFDRVDQANHGVKRADRGSSPQNGER